MKRYFAVVDDRHDVRDPVTVIRVLEGAGPHGITRLNEDAAWEWTTLLDRIAAGEVDCRLQPIDAADAARIRRQRESGIAFRYSVVVREDDPARRPVGVLREWDATGGGSYAEVFTRNREWEHSTIRLDIARGSNAWALVLPTDPATVGRFIANIGR
ncbi:hypothetical protein [Actinoplanes couchii]|uniref:Uncharacterized protein n=1 Tax=Actinoplanes couchii TaxID=403638 RepID=A0ABQ3XMQ2_9ACTN|nr:hypothetical protein [Actinoplanes couchii]MDR6317799.1 hypothetical protein [Actinoplanes couchii]GID59788.1 hypothetical protein Aco03nite_081920 [Actinoplanes couchii]